MKINNLPDIYLFGVWGLDITLISVILILLVILTLIFSNRLLLRVLNRFCEKNLIQARFERFVRVGMRWLLLSIAIILILEILSVDYISVLGHKLYATDKITVEVYNILVLGVVIYLIRILVYLIEFLVDSRISKDRLDKGRGKSFFQIVKYLIWVIGFIIVISTLGVKITLIIASISALLIGVGFGLQHIFNDLFSGVIILFDGSVEVDDVVEVDGTVGRVLDIGLRVSKLLTRDNVVIIIPNSKFTGDNVINWSHNDEVTRFHVTVGVAYGSDVRLVESILMKCAIDHKKISAKPKPFVRFSDFGDSSLDFQIFFWTLDDFRVEDIKSDLRFDIDNQFRKNNVTIPFPQRDLHLKSKDFNG